VFRETDGDGPDDALDADVVPYHPPPQDLLPGAYALASSCEYCGSATLEGCDPASCARPRLFFAKKRPPFAKSSASLLWDPVTDDALAPPPKPAGPSSETSSGPALLSSDPSAGPPRPAPAAPSSARPSFLSGSPPPARTSVRRDLEPPSLPR
jgi:hypothetical protein